MPRRSASPRDRIILSAKVSQVQDLIAVYRMLAARCDYALHLGLTEAGMGSKGIVASSAALGILLQEGIGDTIRVSLTPEPGGDRTLEVKVAQETPADDGLPRLRAGRRRLSRLRPHHLDRLPGAGAATSRTTSPRACRRGSETYPGVEALKVAVMGCIVNGPGESKHADIGISLPGTGEQPDGAGLHRRQEGDDAARPDAGRRTSRQIVEDYVEKRYGGAARRCAPDPARLAARFLEIIETDIVPKTRAGVAAGNKVFGAAILRKDDLSLVLAGTNAETENPLFHGEIATLNAFYRLAAAGAPGDSASACSSRPTSPARSVSPRSPGPASTTSPTSSPMRRPATPSPFRMICASWKRCSAWRTARYRRANAFWTSALDRRPRGGHAGRAERAVLEARIDTLGGVYADLSAAYQARKGDTGIPLS